MTMTSTLRIYDNGGRTYDRYTIIPPQHARHWRGRDGLWPALAASRDPFHPCGFGQHTEAQPGRHLGERIEWGDLPAAVQRFAAQGFPEYVKGQAA